MRTKASVFGFPLHAWFVAIAGGAIVASLVLDALYAWNTDEAWFRASFVVTGVGAIALFAGMVPGFVDYFANIPRRGELWRHANVHALFGLALVGYFIISAGARWESLPQPEPPGAWIALSLNVLGCGALLAQALIGRALVLRHYVSVEGVPLAELPRESKETSKREREPKS